MFDIPIFFKKYMKVISPLLLTGRAKQALGISRYSILCYFLTILQNHTEKLPRL